MLVAIAIAILCRTKWLLSNMFAVSLPAAAAHRFLVARCEGSSNGPPRPIGTRAVCVFESECECKTISTTSERASGSSLSLGLNLNSTREAHSSVSARRPLLAPNLPSHSSPPIIMCKLHTTSLVCSLWKFAALYLSSRSRQRRIRGQSGFICEPYE